MVGKKGKIYTFYVPCLLLHNEYLLFIVNMSSEGTSIHARKRILSSQSHERSNKSRHLQYQQNKDVINGRRRAAYKRKTSEVTLQNDSIVPVSVIVWAI